MSRDNEGIKEPTTEAEISTLRLRERHLRMARFVGNPALKQSVEKQQAAETLGTHVVVTRDLEGGEDNG